MITLSTEGKTINTAPVARLLTEGEKNADVIEIELPRAYGGINLTSLSWALSGASEKDTRVEQALEKLSDGDRMLLRWTVDERWTAVSGPLFLELVGVDGNGNTVIKYTGRPIIVQAAVGGSGAPIPDLTEQYLNTVRALSVQASSSASAAGTSATAAANSANAAKTSQDEAKKSQTAAASSATAANTSRTAAATSATAASNSANTAKGHADAAAASASAAKASETAAADSASGAASSKSAAAASATAAKASETAANTAKTAADASAKAVKASQDAAKASETAAAGSASAAASSKSAAASSATSAANSATAAQTSATNAAAAETAAEESKTAAASSATAANTSKNAAASSATAAANSANTAKGHADSAKASKDAAASSASAAAGSATAAAGSASAANTSKTAAAASATAAKTSQDAAKVSETAAAASAKEAAQSVITGMAGAEPAVKNAAAKSTIVDADSVIIVDSADDSKTKRVLWSGIRAVLNGIFVPLGRKVNGKALSADITFGEFYPVSIAANTDLNSLTQSGFYYCPANATVATLKNCPTTNAFSLEVTKHAGTHHRLVEYTTSSPKIHIRNLYSNTWSAWGREYSTFNKPTPAELGVEALIKNAAAKTTLADADTLPLSDSAATNATKKITWADLVAAIKSKLNTVYAAVTHTHTIEQVDDLSTSLSNKVPLLSAYTAGDITNIPTKTSTYYIGPAVTGMPFDGYPWIADVSSDGTSIVITAYEGNRWHTRYGSAGAWSDWETLATTSDLAGKVNKTGDTFTGYITLNPSNNGSGQIFKNASTSADYGLQLRDIAADGSYMAIFLSANRFDVPHVLRKTGANDAETNVALATAEPPTEYDLPLASGITALQGARYYKNQFKEVAVFASLTGNIPDNKHVATLPIGFRPSITVEYPASFVANGSRVAGTAIVTPDGMIHIHVDPISQSAIFHLHFVAAP